MNARGADQPRVLSARGLARAVLDRVERDGAYAGRALAAALDRAPTLSPEDRALATELVYGVLRRRGRLDRALDALAREGTGHLDLGVQIALRVAAYQLLFLDRVPAYAVVDNAVEACKSARGRGLPGFANALLRKLSRVGEPPLPAAAADPTGYLEASAGLPPWVARLLLAELSVDQAIAFADNLVVPPPVTLRANTLRTTREALGERLAGERPGASLPPSALAPDAILARHFESPAGTAAWRAGLFAVQDAGAQIVAELCGAAAGERILDACAGNGGKTGHLLALSGDRAQVDAMDLSKSKLDEGARTLRRLGVVSSRAIPADLHAAAGRPHAALPPDPPRRALQRARRAAPPPRGAASTLARRSRDAGGAAAPHARNPRAGAPTRWPVDLRRLHLRKAGVPRGGGRVPGRLSRLCRRARRGGRRARSLGRPDGRFGRGADLASARRRRRIFCRAPARAALRLREASQPRTFDHPRHCRGGGGSCFGQRRAGGQPQGEDHAEDVAGAGGINLAGRRGGDSQSGRSARASWRPARRA